MTKDESEKAVRNLCTKWRSDAGYSDEKPEEISFSEFYGWMQNTHSQYLQFRATIGVRETVEHWFNEELHVPHYYR